MDTKQKFKVYCSNLEKQFPLNDGSDELILEAIASTSSIDEEGDMITNECIESMKNQALGLNIHLDHNHDTHNVIGNVIEVLETELSAALGYDITTPPASSGESNENNCSGNAEQT